MLKRGLVMVAMTLSACGQGASSSDVSPTGNTNSLAPASPPTSPTSSGSSTAGSSSSPLPSSGASGDPNNPNVYGGAPRCANANVQFCESWEELAVGAAPNPKVWTVSLANSQHSIAVSNSRAARGTHSLHVHVPNTFPMNAMMSMDSVFPAPNNTLYGRVFLYFDAGVPRGHTTLIRALGTDGASQETVQFGDMFTNYVANWSSPSPRADNGIYSKVAFPAKQWVCLEWAHKGDAGEFDVWADGQVIFSAPNDWLDNGKVVAGPKPVTYNSLGLGWVVYEQFDNDAKLPAYDLYFDELALDPNRIGCDR